MEVKILKKGVIKTRPGGVYEMHNPETGQMEQDIAKLHILQSHIQRQIEVMCGISELPETPEAEELVKIARAVYDRDFRYFVDNYDRQYVREFDVVHYPVTVPDFLLDVNSWTDISWHNDIAPSFHSVKKDIKVWVNFDNQEHREDCFNNRFSVERCDEEGSWIETLFETDDVEQLKLFLKEIGY